mmetsp:Transcript_7445/g.11125  ORF Transcript_7445/g.11125 Transcript_7445/m.11125 type:complete len:260 (+) Transcript_7445:305-1084(+)
MEWCVRNPSQIEVLGIRRVNADTASSIIQEASPRQVTPSKHTQASPSLNHDSTGSALISPSQSYNYGGELEPKYAFDAYASTGYAESNPSQSYHYAGHRPNYASIGYAENIPSQRSQGHTPTTAFTGFAVARSLEPNGDDSERDTNQPSYYGTTGYAEASFDADDDNTSNTIENGAACVSCWTEDNDYQYAEENETIQAYDNDTNQYDDGLDYDDVTYSDGGGGNDDYSDNGGGDCDDYSDGGGGGYDDYSDGAGYGSD